MNVTVAWTPPVLKPGQSTIASYNVYSQAQGAPSFGLLGNVPAPGTSLLDENVADGTWFYQVTTVDSKGRESAPSSPPAQANVNTPPDSVAPSPPTGVTATPG